MFVRQLDYLVALAREKHFARAAATCNITQPTLSSAIRKLEDEIGSRLVIRGHRFMGLTPAGERVVQWANKTIAGFDCLRHDLGASREGLQGALRLGVIPAAMPAVAALTEPFCAKHPNITVDVQSLPSIAIQRGLDEFKLDAGVTYLDNEPLHNVRKTPLYRERYLFVTSVHGPHAHRQSITWREAVAEKLCLPAEDMQNRRVLNAVVATLSMSLKPTVVSNSFLGVCAHVGRGTWSSIVPHSFAAFFADRRDLKLIELVEPAHSETIGLVVSDRDPLTPLARELMACTLPLALMERLTAAVPTAID
jgi:DNA-binding transcriptional LysR family regulator